LETRELLEKVRRIEIKTRRLSDHLFSGEYHSTFKGRGMAFSEVRMYQYGDDIRSIDWNVTARLNEPYVKIFEEDRELTMMLLIDVSGSGDFGTRKSTKKELITELAAVLAFSAMTNNDKVGALLFSDDIELFIPPKKGKSHILRIVRELLEFKPKSKKTQIATAFKFLSNVLKKKAIVFCISDFFDEGYQDTLKIAAKKHELTCIKINDPSDEQMPEMGLLKIMDSETGNTRWKWFGAKQKQMYLDNIRKKQEYYTQGLKASGAGSVQLYVHQPYVSKLLAYFKNK